MDNLGRPGADPANLRSMTDAQLCVRLPDLQTTLSSLAAVEDRLGGATSRVRDVGGDEAGFVAVELEAFADHWAHGVTTLHQHLAALRTALAEVHHAYATHEAAIADGLTGAGS